MEQVKKILITLNMTILVILLTNSSAMAKDINTKDSITSELEVTIEATPPYNDYNQDAGGTLSKKEILDRQQNKKEFITSGYIRVYKYVDIIRSYDGYRDRGKVAKGTNTKDTYDTLGFSYGKNVSNTASIATGFTKNSVEVVVGYDLSWSQYKSWSYNAVVGPGKTVYIGYKDWYHTDKLKFTTRTESYLGNSLSPIVKYSYDNGFADQWYMPEFYSYY